jgi:RNA polymerase sigma-70 factor (ECF subfamily)
MVLSVASTQNHRVKQEVSRKSSRDPRNDLASFGPWHASRPRLLRLCLRFTRGNLAEAEDLLGEAYLKAIEAQSQGVHIQSQISFSTTIIANLARDRHRATRNGHMQRSLADSDSSLASDSPSPDQQVCARESLRQALRLLERVPGRQRWALLLRTLGDDYLRIAQTVGTTEQNARKLVQFARAAVQASE